MVRWHYPGYASASQDRLGQIRWIYRHLSVLTVEKTYSQAHQKSLGFNIRLLVGSGQKAERPRNYAVCRSLNETKNLWSLKPSTETVAGSTPLSDDGALSRNDLREPIQFEDGPWWVRVR